MPRNSMGNMDVIKSKKSRFLSYFEESARINSVITLCFLTSSLVCVFLTGALLKSTLAPKSIYYIPGANSAGYATANELPQSSVSGFAVSWILNMLNFTPETVDVVYERTRKYMFPEMLSKSSGTMDKEIEDIKKSSISSIFSITKEPVFDQDDKVFLVTILGEHSLFMGKSVIKTAKAKYVISLIKVSPTDVNPFGLMVTNVYKEELEKESKDEI